MPKEKVRAIAAKGRSSSRDYGAGRGEYQRKGHEYDEEVQEEYSDEGEEMAHRHGGSRRGFAGT